jgi:hypothetical protein
MTQVFFFLTGLGLGWNKPIPSSPKLEGWNPTPSSSVFLFFFFFSFFFFNHECQPPKLLQPPYVAAICGRCSAATATQRGCHLPEAKWPVRAAGFNIGNSLFSHRIGAGHKEGRHLLFEEKKPTQPYLGVHQQMVVTRIGRNWGRRSANGIQVSLKFLGKSLNLGFTPEYVNKICAYNFFTVIMQSRLYTIDKTCFIVCNYPNKTVWFSCTIWCNFHVLRCSCFS